jgi:hypothetical protein
METQDLDRLVAGASDEELATLMSGPRREQLLGEAFARLEQRLAPLSGEELVTHWAIRERPGGGDDTWELALRDGSVSAAPGASGAAQVGFSVRPTQFLELVTGHASGAQMLSRGQLRLTGDVVAARRIADLLPLTNAESAAARERERVRRGGGAARGGAPFWHADHSRHSGSGVHIAPVRVPMSMLRELVMLGGSAVLTLVIMFMASLALWLGVPIGWLWVGAQIQSSGGGALTSAVAIVVVLRWLSERQQAMRRARGLPETEHSLLELVMVLSATVTIVAFGVWFFLFAGANLAPVTTG